MIVFSNMRNQKSNFDCVCIEDNITLCVREKSPLAVKVVGNKPDKPVSRKANKKDTTTTSKSRTKVNPSAEKSTHAGTRRPRKTEAAKKVVASKSKASGSEDEQATSEEDQSEEEVSHYKDGSY